jgi:type I restriction enzyme S subunit
LSPKFVRELDAASPQTTIKTITAPSLKALKIPLPPLPEQHHISYVLSTVQIAIKQQAQLITLMRELKSALMHKLFAEGLHGEKQKETEIGLVPESWEIKPFEEFTTLQRGKDLTKKEFKEGSVPVAGSNGVIGYHDTSFVKGPGVTVGRSGSVGRVTLYDQDFWAHNTSLYVKDFHDNDPRFAAYYLEVMNLARFKTGASVPTLDRNSFKLMPVAVPPREEQVEIRHILETTDKKIEITNLWKAKLEELFRTLLHQLMTGQIRVNEIDLPGIP